MGVASVGHAEEIITLAGGDFNDLFREDPVISSGGLVVGVTGSGEPTERFPELRAAIPADWDADRVCVSVVSADGRYEARNTYAVPSGSIGQIARIEYGPTEYLEVLREFDPGRMAVLVSRGRCEVPEDVYTVAFWRAAPAAMPDHIQIMINSFRAEQVLLYPGPEALEPIKCVRLDGPGQTAFDTVCKVPISELGAGETEIEVVAIHNRTPDPLPPFRVHVDAAP